MNEIHWRNLLNKFARQYSQWETQMENEEDTTEYYQAVDDFNRGTISGPEMLKLNKLHPPALQRLEEIEQLLDEAIDRLDALFTNHQAVIKYLMKELEQQEQEQSRPKCL